MDGYKHYIRTDGAGIIILGFSSAFPETATPQDGDICILEDGPRHFTEAWPEPLTNGRGQFLYKWQGERVERTQEELFDLNAYKQQKIEELRSARDYQLLAGFASNATGVALYFGFDAIDQAYLQEKALLMSIDPAVATIDWKTRDGWVAFTRDQFFRVIKDAGAHKEGLVRQLMQLEAQVLNSATENEVNAIVW